MKVRVERPFELSGLQLRLVEACPLVAKAGDDHYGRLSVLTGWRAEARILFDVNPSAFVPPPKVTSSIVRLVPRAAPLACDRAAFERVTAAAFGQRRKMLRASLRTLGSDPAALLGRAGIEPTKRAEEIDVAGFIALANALAKVEPKAPGERP